MKPVAAWLSWLAALALVGVAAPSVAAAEWWAIGGRGAGDLKLGAAIARSWISGQPIQVATAPDGSFAFSSEASVYWVRGGHIAAIARRLEPSDMVFEPDGSLLVSDRSAVWRLDARGQRTAIAGRPDRPGSSGDGGPATLSRLTCPGGLDVDGAGGILVADRCARRVRRISPDGRITTVAGNGTRGGHGDGGAATAASLRGPGDVAALANGAFAVIDGPPQTDPGDRIRVVDPAGRIETRARVHATELAAEPDDAILMVDWTAERGALITRLRPTGDLETVVARSQRAGIDSYEWCVGRCAAQIDSVARAPDGSLLVGGDFALLYVPSQTPAELAAAVGAGTRAQRTALEVTVRLTRPAHVRVRVWGRRGLAATRALDLPAGDSRVPFGELTRPDNYEIELTATDGEEVAVADGAALAGGLPFRFAREYIRNNRPRPFAGTELKLNCRRRGAWRVDCDVSRRRRCVARVTVRVLTDGTVSKVVRRSQRRRCR